MRHPSPLLVVGHDASRTGAPLTLLSWLRWMRSQPHRRLEVVLLDGGPLVPALEALAATRVRSRVARTLTSSRSAFAEHTLLRGAARGATTIGRIRHSMGADAVVVAASIASWSEAAAVRPRRRLVCWVHELDGLADRLLTKPQQRELIDQTDHFVAVGPRVRTMLVDRWGVPAGRVTVVDSFIDAPSTHGSRPVGLIPVLGVGSLVPRKGADVFVAVVASIARLHEPMRAAWLGGDPRGSFADLVAADVEHAGLIDRCTLVGAVQDLDSWWPADGLLLHVPREDPAPLVVLEAAQRGVPVVTWDTGGAADLVRASGHPELVLGAGDIVGAAAAAAGLLGDRTTREQAGADLRGAARSRTTEALGPQLLGAIEGDQP